MDLSYKSNKYCFTLEEKSTQVKLKITNRTVNIAGHWSSVNIITKQCDGAVWFGKDV